MQRELWVNAEVSEQPGSEVAIQLNSIHSAATGYQGGGQRALAGPDLHDVIILRGTDGTRDLVNYRFIAEKVLAEALSGLVSQSLNILSCEADMIVSKMVSKSGSCA